MLEEHRKDQEARMKEAGGLYHDEGWMCPDRFGRLVNPQAFASAFDRVALIADVDITLHGLRHTQATELLVRGIPPRSSPRSSAIPLSR
jgi:integrase